ncbi:MAG: hypothetical protein IJ153_04305 [Clostridia bacterium]|nr:hypothetical protein [Clostridia bacterium]
MVKMENINREGDVISMDCYEEGDLNRAHHVIFDIATLEIKNQAVNNVYTRQGIWRIHSILKEGNQLPRYASSYWC